MRKHDATPIELYNKSKAYFVTRHTDKKLLKNVICGIVMLKVVLIVQYSKVRCAIPSAKTANYCSMHPLIHTLLALMNTES